MCDKLVTPQNLSSVETASTGTDASISLSPTIPKRVVFLTVQLSRPGIDARTCNTLQVILSVPFADGCGGALA